MNENVPKIFKKLRKFNTEKNTVNKNLKNVFTFRDLLSLTHINKQNHGIHIYNPKNMFEFRLIINFLSHHKITSNLYLNPIKNKDKILSILIQLLYDSGQRVYSYMINEFKYHKDDYKTNLVADALTKKFKNFMLRTNKFKISNYNHIFKSPKTPSSPKSKTPSTSKPKTPSSNSIVSPKSNSPKTSSPPKSNSPKTPSTPKSNSPKTPSTPKSNSPKTSSPPKSNSPKTSSPPKSTASPNFKSKFNDYEKSLTKIRSRVKILDKAASSTSEKRKTYLSQKAATSRTPAKYFF